MPFLSYQNLADRDGQVGCGSKWTLMCWKKEKFEDAHTVNAFSEAATQRTTRQFKSSPNPQRESGTQIIDATSSPAIRQGAMGIGPGCSLIQ
jgi:hypothetical protein